MHGFESILDQQRPVGILTAYLTEDAIPHALLFTGARGVGKRTTAWMFAMACNCLRHAPLAGTDNRKNPSVRQTERFTANPCYECRSCKKIQSKNHPDIIDIQPSGPFIRIDQIRNLCHILSMKPYEARQRVVIVANAQAMNTEAGNALLKMLEEPPERTLLILTATQRSDLLPTIASRCQHIRFNPVSRESIAAFLMEKHGVKAMDAPILAALADGSLSKALDMMGTDWIDWRNWLIHTLTELPARSLTARLAFAEKLSKNKHFLEDSLEVMKTWFRDLAIYRYAPDQMINRDFIEQIKAASGSAGLPSVCRKIDAVQSAEKKIRSNTSLRLTMEVLACRLSDN